MIRMAIITLICCTLVPSAAWCQAPAPQSFIVIQINHASPLLIAYAVQADDVIWEDSGSSGGGSGYGSSGRSQTTSSRWGYSNRGGRSSNVGAR